MTQIQLLGALGTNEIIIIMVIVLLMFGGRKIPELMRGLGKGVREFNDAKDNVKKKLKKALTRSLLSLKEPQSNQQLLF
ncbi:Sec-independent protein translocase subunit TatA/TatB [Niabella ginsengisoli]|uniref:Twin-arginine translocase TatA/TatE family subunit n=1 Tax=Niabella ginsengisoli TaxID=522298 RepID=A0ABS9SE73_9BACT|nr:twin-arginine translocase TatA/TatE family subunit [Niabella ginsengisoli]MCH5596654.1 twin-arginine translocase TatA/TatE family subunit [Niabella ginsengisoli]